MIRICGDCIFRYLFHYRLGFLDDKPFEEDEPYKHTILADESKIIHFRDEAFFSDELKTWHQHKNDHTTRTLKKKWNAANWKNVPSSSQIVTIERENNLRSTDYLEDAGKLDEETPSYTTLEQYSEDKALSDEDKALPKMNDEIFKKMVSMNLSVLCMSSERTTID